VLIHAKLLYRRCTSQYCTAAVVPTNPYESVIRAKLY
jgi:hypothetical protein